MSGLRSCALGALLLALAPVTRAEAPKADAAVEIGRDSYQRYCASCHGVNADGNGPLASLIRTAPSDLRRLVQRYGSPLDVDAIAKYVDGRSEVPVHGRRGMPVWGERFEPEPAEGGPGPRVHPQVRAIVAYLATIQYEAAGK
jgi:mono/diheme cytochrome c family protein